MMVDSTDFKCPTCMQFVYDRYKCANGHLICGDCFVRVETCPVCRNNKLVDSNKEPLPEEVQRRVCKNKEKGCDLSVYDFDDEHEKECRYNPFHCKICKMNIEDKTHEKIIEHYRSNCVNVCNILSFTRSEEKKERDKEGETKGRKYKLSHLKCEMTLIVVDDQYFVLIIPKKSKESVNLMIFSVNDKYKLSNYKVGISDQNDRQLRESMIYYNSMIDLWIPIKSVLSTYLNTLQFSIENIFIINRRVERACYGNTYFFETHTVDGEPGSAGNWTKEDRDKFSQSLKNIFR